MPPLSSLGASWERVLIPQPDASYEPRELRRSSGLSHPTNFSAPSPPVDPVEQLLPRSFSTTLSLFPSCCRRVQTYRHSVGWADDHTCSDCHAVDHMGWPTSLASISHTCNGSHTGEYVGGTPLSRSFLGGLPQFADLHSILIDFDSFHSLPCFENKFTLSMFNCQLKLCKCSFCASIVFQIVSLSFVLQIWDCHLFCQDCQFILQIVQSIQLNCHLVHLIVILCVTLSHFCGDCSF